MGKSPDRLMSAKGEQKVNVLLTDDKLIAIRNVATDTRAISIINELLDKRQQAKDWRECADKLSVFVSELQWGPGSKFYNHAEVIKTYSNYQDLLKKYGEK